MSSPSIIEMEQVSKIYGKITAVDQLSLSVRQGEFLSLLGPSGCGKTTTLRMLAGFEYPTHGTIQLQNKESSQIPPYERPVNTVFQNYALFPHLTISDNIAFGLKRQNLDKVDIQQKVKDMIQTMGLEEHQQKYPHQLSGGQQQRVALARALVNQPKVLLLDEPLGALDLKLRKKMQFELKRLHKQVGITFIYVAHDQEEALVMSDRIAVMKQGRIEQIGTPEEIYNQPASSYVADFIGEANILPTVAHENQSVRVLDYVFPVDNPTANNSFVIRPEQIQISQEEPPPENPDRLYTQVKMLDVTYAGAKVMIQVEADNHTITVHHPFHSYNLDLSSGQLAYISWNRQDGKILQ